MSNTQIHVQINDGKTAIDRWPYAFEHLPTIGDVIAISSVGGSAPTGYDSKAEVFRIDRDLSTGEVTIILDLKPASSKAARPVAFLNADYIPEHLRRDVEEHLRGQLEVPAFEWVQSTDPSPVLRVHQGLSEIQPEIVAKLQKGVRKILDAASPLASV